MGKDSSEVRREIEETRARMGDTVEALAYKSDVPARVKDNITEKVETVKGTIGDMVGTVKETLSDAAQRLGDTTSNMTSGVTENVPSPGELKGMARRGVGIAMENPLGLALGALAVGFLAGLATPVTDYEREKVGPIRDDLVDKAQNVGSDMLEHGKQIVKETAQAALHTAQQSAQSHGEQVLTEARGDGL